MTIKRFAYALAAASAFMIAAGSSAIGEDCPEKDTKLKLPDISNDYPTNARADYVYGCMLVNGMTRDVVDRCSCSIDVIASVLPYAQYEEAETILSVRQRGGESVAYMYGPQFIAKVNDLKRAQVEGEVRCF
ncbi:MAG TPA: hypothetical protein PLW75_10875 [Hyphomicrobium sp.]|nr:hypothetical protein [Hyphomicrobium sp.]